MKIIPYHTERSCKVLKDTDEGTCIQHKSGGNLASSGWFVKHSLLDMLKSQQMAKLAVTSEERHMKGVPSTNHDTVSSHVYAQSVSSEIRMKVGHERHN